MNYSEALNYIHTIPKFRRPLGNANLKRLLAALGNPQKKLKFIHIAGTNGKGSCAAMTASILAAAGYKTGMYTSPYIEIFNERIQINGALISNDDLAAYTERVKTAMNENDAQVSEFAFITAAAMLYFYEKQCDFVVLEAGLGGRLDATNVIDSSLVSVLMSISLDHMQYLGDTVSEIAEEKCGIIKENGTVVSYPNDDVMGVIKSACEKKHARLTAAEKPQICGGGFIYKGEKYGLSLKGLYQPMNAAVVLEIIGALRSMGYKIDINAVRYGLLHTSWQARFEYIAENVIIDGGHNIDGIHALKNSLSALGKNIILVMAMMRDKSYDVCIADIAPIAKEVIASQLDFERCLEAEEIKKICITVNTPCEVIKDVKTAAKTALSLAGDNDIVCFCGSLYLAGEVRKLLHRKERL